MLVDPAVKREICAHALSKGGAVTNIPSFGAGIKRKRLIKYDVSGPTVRPHAYSDDLTSGGGLPKHDYASEIKEKLRSKIMDV